ncbi:inositol-1-monophosphatase [Actinobacillus pleuropneumoniae]|nr:inositol-1-monophosphatase [Actinobacillus pleuropneumoniae]
MLNIAIRAARKAGNIIAKGYEQAASEIEVAQKGTNDYVTAIDKAAEAAIIEVIRKSYPDHAIVGGRVRYFGRRKRKCAMGD